MSLIFLKLFYHYRLTDRTVKLNISPLYMRNACLRNETNKIEIKCFVFAIVQCECFSANYIANLIAK